MSDAGTPSQAMTDDQIAEFFDELDLRRLAMPPHPIRPKSWIRKTRAKHGPSVRRVRNGGPFLFPMQTVDDEGVERWLDESCRLHRENGPALTRPDGSQEWRVENLLHRTDGPAVIGADGSEEFWSDGWRRDARA